MIRATKANLADDIRDIARKVISQTPGHVLLPSLEKMNYEDLDRLALAMKELTEHDTV